MTCFPKAEVEVKGKADIVQLWGVCLEVGEQWSFFLHPVIGMPIGM